MITSIPILKDIVGWLRQTELVEYLKSELAKMDARIEDLQKRIEKHLTKSKSKK